MFHLIAQIHTHDFASLARVMGLRTSSGPPKPGVMIIHHAALRMFATGAARRIRATTLMILATLGRISDAANYGKSSGAKKHDRGG
jgi:hypothetical protein